MPTPPEVLCGAVAAELRVMARLVDSLAELLIGDEDVALRHSTALQGFDLLAQCAGESAALLERVAAGACPRSAIDAVRLEEVQQRLRAAIGPGPEIEHGDPGRGATILR